MSKHVFQRLVSTASMRQNTKLLIIVLKIKMPLKMSFYYYPSVLLPTAYLKVHNYNHVETKLVIMSR